MHYYFHALVGQSVTNICSVQFQQPFLDVFRIQDLSLIFRSHTLSQLPWDLIPCHQKITIQIPFRLFKVDVPLDRENIIDIEMGTTHGRGEEPVGEQGEESPLNVVIKTSRP